MFLGGRYELAEVVAEDAESRTFAARESESGHAVLVHQILPPPPASLRPSLQGLAGRCVPGRGGVIERIESEGSEYLVTEAREEFRDLRGALERIVLIPPPAPAGAGEDRFTRVGAWRVPASFSTPSASPDSREPSVSGIFGSPAGADTLETSRPESEITRTPRPAGPEPADLPAEAPVPSPAAGPLEAPPPPPAGPGEFTRMFQAPTAGPPAASPPTPATSEPGEFTRMFRAQDAVRTPAPPPRAAAPAQGDFTQLFSAPAPAKPAPLATQPAKVEPGEFTRFFESPLGVGVAPASKAASPPLSPSAPPPPASPQPGEYTRLFQTPAPPAAPPARESGATRAFVTPAAFPSQPSATSESVPSDFTRIIQARSPAPAAVSPPEPSKAPAAEAPARPQGVPVGLVILFACLAVVAITLVLFFAFRR